jgi:hypothetical protein
MEELPWASIVAVGFSLAAFLFSLSAERRARRAEVTFNVELDEEHKGRIIVRNTGSKTVRNVHIAPDNLSGVRYTASHNKPRTLISGDKLEVWADAADHDNIPNTLRIRFGRFGARAVRVPGEGRPVV